MWVLSPGPHSRNTGDSRISEQAWPGWPWLGHRPTSVDGAAEGYGASWAGQAHVEMEVPGAGSWSGSLAQASSSSTPPRGRPLEVCCLAIESIHAQEGKTRALATNVKAAFHLDQSARWEMRAPTSSPRVVPISVLSN